MSQNKDKIDLEEQESKEETQVDMEEILDELEENQDENTVNENDSDEVAKLKDMLSRVNADYQNFKTRTIRDKEDMVFFLKQDIFKKILPRVDDLERIIKNTPLEQKETSIYKAIEAMEKAFKRDLENMGLKEFVSLWEELDPNKHEVMTQVPWENPGIIIDEFEKWYMIWDRVLRVAKVVVRA